MNRQLTASDETRKKKLKKIFAACVLLLVAVIAVFAVRHAAKQYEEKKYLESYGQTAMTVGSDTVTYDIYRYFYLNYRDSLEHKYTDANGGVDTSALDREVRERVADAVCGLYGTISLADDYGMTVTDGDVKAAADTFIEAVKNDYKQNGGSYTRDLAANYMTEQVFTFITRVDALEDKLFTALVSDGGKIEDNDEKLLEILGGDAFVRAKLIFIENDEGESVEENRLLAKEALAAYKDGTSFDTLIGRYSEDYSMPYDGYYFTRMEMIDVIEAAAFSMEDNTVSDVLESDDGFYLLLRLPKDAAYITENFEDLKSQYQSAVFYGMIDTRSALLHAEESAYVRSLSYEEIR